jgi:hypothetical protein
MYGDIWRQIPARSSLTYASACDNTLHAGRGPRKTSSGSSEVPSGTNLQRAFTKCPGPAALEGVLTPLRVAAVAL